MQSRPEPRRRRAGGAEADPARATLDALDWPVHIGEAARRSGVSAKMLRHYESLGLLAGVARTDSGYRLYSEDDVHHLRFIKRGRDLGFSMAEIADLLGLWRDRGRSNTKVRAIAQRHVDDLGTRIAAMQAMRRTLSHLVDCCAGDERPDCPILDDLAGLPHARPDGQVCEAHHAAPPLQGTHHEAKRRRH